MKTSHWADRFDADVDPTDDANEFSDPCNLGKPIGDINRWESIISTKLTDAINQRREYHEKYCPTEPVPDLNYSYNDLVPGADVKKNLFALRFFYNNGYRYYRPLMMWYLENGMLIQYLNAASSIYHCDRDCPDFWLLLKRAAEIGNNEKFAVIFPVVLYQYFNWGTYDGVRSVRITLPTIASLSNINKLLKQYIPQRKQFENNRFVISHNIVKDDALLKDDEDYDDHYERIKDEFNKKLEQLMLETWQENASVFEKHLFHEESS